MPALPGLGIERLGVGNPLILCGEPPRIFLCGVFNPLTLGDDGRPIEFCILL